jgi:hypothetical protein
VANLLLKHGPAVTTTDTTDSTPLHELCSGAWRQRVQRVGGWRALADLCALFLSHGADPNAANHAGDTPFTLVVQQLAQQQRGALAPEPDIRADIIACFLAHGADPNARVGERLSVLSVVCIGSHKPGSGGQGGLEKAHVEMARVLLEAGANIGQHDVENTFSARATPLMHLCGCAVLNSWSEKHAVLLMEHGAGAKGEGYNAPLYSLLDGRLFEFWAEVGDQGGKDGNGQEGAGVIGSMERMALELIRRGASMTQKGSWPGWETAPVECLKIELSQESQKGPLWVPAGFTELQKVAPAKAALVERRRADNGAIRAEIEAFKERLLQAERMRDDGNEGN